MCRPVTREKSTAMMTLRTVSRASCQPPGRPTSCRSRSSRRSFLLQPGGSIGVTCVATPRRAGDRGGRTPGPGERGAGTAEPPAGRPRRPDLPRLALAVRPPSWEGPRAVRRVECACRRSGRCATGTAQVRRRRWRTRRQRPTARGVADGVAEQPAERRADDDRGPIQRPHGGSPSRGQGSPSTNGLNPTVRNAYGPSGRLDRAVHRRLGPTRHPPKKRHLTTPSPRA